MRRKYATEEMSRRIGDSARAVGITPGAVRFSPDGTVEIIDKSLVQPRASAPAGGGQVDAKTKLRAFRERQDV